MKEHILYKADKLILFLIFGLAIYLPFFVGIIQEDKISSKVERRNLNVPPSVPTSMQEVVTYPEAFNLYYSDHFGFREQLTEEYFKLINKIGGQSSVDIVTIGQEGWFFLGSIKPGYTRYHDPMGDAINVNLFSEKELEEFANSLMTIKNWLKKREIEYIYVIAPNKHTIYFEKLPTYIKKKNSRSATDQLVSYLQKNTDVNVIDLRQVLMKAKEKHQVYFKTDTHWNHYGANVAQFEIINSVMALFPQQISSSLLGDNQFEILTRNDGGLADFAKIDNLYEDEPNPVFENTCTPVKEPLNAEENEIHTMMCDSQALNAVIFRDSFFSALKPYISRHFNRSTYIWTKLNYNSLLQYVELEKPDIVIDEVVERSFPYVPSSDLFREND